jgi:hypothetical protein
MNRKTQFFQKHILNDKKLSTIQIRDKLFKDIFGFTRMRKDLKPRVLSILEHVVTHQRSFNYRYYLNKSCPIPIPNWHTRKQEMIVDAEKSGDAKGKVYKELFEEGTTDYRNVADFLTEFVANVFPTDFMDGKNRKVFNQKVL